MKTLTKDARGFVTGVVDYLRKEGRAHQSIPKVRSLFQKVTSQARRESQALVESAVTLTAEEKKRVTIALENLLEHTLTVHFSIQTDLIGGLRIKVADWTIDTSMQEQLRALQASLTNEQRSF